METNTEIGFWNQVKVKIKQKYPNITDNDLLFNDGKEQEMLEMLGYKLGKTKEQIHNLISSI
jgi:uncharacterized protein YjbJ (UPF0337 family)